MKLQLKRSNVLESGSAKQPTAAQLEYGELAINYNKDDPAIFLKDSNNNVIRISGADNIADDGTTEVPAGTTPPLNPEPGNLWFNSAEGRLYIYYKDVDTEQWVDASPDSYDPAVIPDMTDPNYQPGTLDDRYNSSQVGEFPPDVNLRNEGALWWNSQNDEGKLYVLYNDPAPDGRKKWVEASPHPDVSGFISGNDGGDQQEIIGGGGLKIDGDLNVGGIDLANRDTDGALIYKSGRIVVQKRRGQSGNVFSVKQGDASQGTPIETVAFTSDGTATFAGNMGIGLTSPQYPLDVNGNIRCGLTDGYGFAQFGTDSTASDNWHIGSEGDGTFRIYNGNLGSGSQRLRIESSGHVGISTTAPRTVLDVNNGAHTGDLPDLGGLLITNAGTSTNTAAVCVATGRGAIFNVMNTGKVLVGTIAERNNFLNANFSAQLQIEGTGHSTSSFSLTRNADNNGCAYINFAKSRGDANGSNVLVQDGDKMGSLSFQGSDGTNFIEAARIDGRVDGTAGSADMPGRLQFFTTSDGATEPTERMRITSTGQMRLAGAGITFNGDTAQANELDDYEEGVWTPTDVSGAGMTFVIGSSFYTRVGRLIICQATFAYPTTSDTTNARIGGLPFVNTSAGGGFSQYTTTSLGSLVFRNETLTTNLFVTVGDDQDRAVKNNELSGASVQIVYIYAFGA